MTDTTSRASTAKTIADKCGQDVMYSTQGFNHVFACSALKEKCLSEDVPTCLMARELYWRAMGNSGVRYVSRDQAIHKPLSLALSLDDNASLAADAIIFDGYTKEEVQAVHRQAMESLTERANDPNQIGRGWDAPASLATRLDDMTAASERYLRSKYPDAFLDLPMEFELDLLSCV